MNGKLMVLYVTVPKINKVKPGQKSIDAYKYFIQ